MKSKISQHCSECHFLAQGELQPWFPPNHEIDLELRKKIRTGEDLRMDARQAIGCNRGTWPGISIMGHPEEWRPEVLKKERKGLDNWKSAGRKVNEHIVKLDQLLEPWIAIQVNRLFKPILR